jgi:hypothetical protein
VMTALILLQLVLFRKICTVWTTIFSLFKIILYKWYVSVLEKVLISLLLLTIWMNHDHLINLMGSSYIAFHMLSICAQ